jgi:hypothetical protein
MQVKIFVNENQLEEVSRFLKSGIAYEHNIEFDTNPVENSVEVQIFYEDYVTLDTWRIHKSKMPKL